MGTFTENPVLQKELRSHLLSRRQSKAVRVAASAIAAILVGLMYYFSFRAIVRGQMEGRDLFQVVAWCQLVLIVFLAPSLTANAITQEREQQTWNALLLTRLSGDEIVIGKLLARLAPAAILLLLFVPLSLLAAVAGNLPASAVYLSYLLLITTTVFYGVIGLFSSWVYRRTSVATSAASGVIAFFVVGTYLLLGLWAAASGFVGFRTEEFVPLWLNPFMAMGVALGDLGYGSPTTSYAPLVAYLIVCVVGTLLLVTAMVRRLARGPKELEQ